MKTLIKWAVKKFANNAKIKEAIHAANKKLAEKEGGDRTAEITGYCNDVAETLAVYASAYSNDGKIDDSELDKVNAKDDKMVDKYLTDAKIETVIDALFD